MALGPNQKFFYKHAGFSYNPATQTKRQGRERTARLLAQAEKDARRLGIYFDWEVDMDGCIGCTCGGADCSCCTGVPHETLGCVARASDGEALASLWGICEPTREYKRVVEAELALEALQL